MSVLGFFEATINYWEQLEKKTPTRVKEMKDAIMQFKTSKWAGDFEDENPADVAKIERKFDRIYKDIYK